MHKLLTVGGKNILHKCIYYSGGQQNLAISVNAYIISSERSRENFCKTACREIIPVYERTEDIAMEKKID